MVVKTEDGIEYVQLGYAGDKESMDYLKENAEFVAKQMGAKSYRIEMA